MFFFSWVLLTYFALGAHATPRVPSLLHRDTTATNAPVVNATATVLDHSGFDVTSSFKIMAYYQTLKKPLTNTTGNKLNDRQGTEFERLMNACPRNETFLESHCNPQGGQAGSLQRYSYTCRRMVNRYSRNTGRVIGRMALHRIRTGYCLPHEVCVNGLAQRLVASCVESWVFDEYKVERDGQVRSILEGPLFNVERAYAVMSKMDKSTPIEVDTYDVDAWVDGVMVENGTVQSNKCRDCVDLVTNAFEPKTDALKVEATLLTTGAVAGILWLAFISG